MRTANFLKVFWKFEHKTFLNSVAKGEIIIDNQKRDVNTASNKKGKQRLNIS